MEEKYRHLTQDEINKLIKNNCRCYDWNDIMVASNFTCDNILNVNFSGKIKLGVFNKKDIVLDGIVKHPGIFNASINNCTIGNDVYICAGTTITKNIEDGDFVIGRAREVIKKGRAKDYLKTFKTERH
ncbi:MAG: DUF4954 family protein [Clostridia bacterium]|nr:DUF4954 family protein [Clostridia bacterium]